MLVFVTGATGFIGSHVIRELINSGHKVRALKRKGSSPRIDLLEEPEWIEGDLTSCPDKALIGCDIFIHLAAAGVHNLHDWDCFDINVHQSLSIWRRAVDLGIKKFIITGSCFEYGLSADAYETIPVSAPLYPTAAYHASKASATMAALALAVDEQLQMVIVRPFHVYGQGESRNRFWPALKKAAFDGRNFDMTTGEQIRDFISVDDVAKQMLQICPFDGIESGRPLVKNIGTGKPQSLRQFALFWWKEWGAKGHLNFGAIPNRKNEVMRYVPEV